MIGMQLGKRCSQVLGMHDLVRWFLVVHLPAHGRRWRGRDEEQLVRLGQRQVLVAGVQRSIQTKVHPHTTAHYLLAINLLADRDSGVDIEERNDDAFKRLERRPGVDRGMPVDRLADLDQVGGAEYLRLDEVLDPVNCDASQAKSGALTVIMSVFEGGDGCTSGGRSERSSDSGGLVLDEARERCGGVDICADMVCDIAAALQDAR